MKRVSRRVGVLLLAGGAGLIAAGCGADRDEDVRGSGQLSLPLMTHGPSGVTYRIRNANFLIQRAQNYYENEGGSGPNPGNIIVNSESDPDASLIAVAVEQGNYRLRLLPGWSFEKQGSGGAEPVKATLLSSETANVFVQARTTSWASFDFGIGNREIWLNGKLNISISVEEQAGASGESGVADSHWATGEGGAF